MIDPSTQYDIISCLEVLPEEGDTYWTFEVRQHGLRLVLSVFYFERDVSISLHFEGIDNEILRIDLLSVRWIRHVKEKNGYECLEIISPVGELAHKLERPVPVGVRVSVRPHLQISLINE